MKRSVLFGVIAGCLFAAAAWWVSRAPQTEANSGNAHNHVRSLATSAIEPVQPSPPSSTEPTRGRLPAQPAVADLATAFNSSQDYFEFARSVAEAAAQGDAKAAYYLSLALRDCQTFASLLKRLTGLTQPQAALAALQESQPGLLPEQRQADQHRLQRCEKFFNANPLDGYSASIRERTASEWLKTAQEGGDAAATADYLVSAVTMNEDKASQRRMLLTKEVPAFVQQVMSSKDPRSVAALGRLLMHPDVGSEPLEGYAWLMAACNMGYDCSIANREIGLPCAQTDSCDPRVGVVDWMRDGLSPTEFAQAYADAQQIQFGIQSSDTRTLQRHLGLKTE